MYNLASMLEDGAEGVPKDPRRAISLYQHPTDAGNARAMSNLAHTLQQGERIQFRSLQSEIAV